MKQILSKLRNFLMRYGERIFLIIILLCIFSAALLVRLQPLKWGYYLTEFDPYYQYYMARWVSSHGWTGFIEWFRWGIDKRFWYPYGRHISKTSLPGVAFIGAFSYLTLKTFGIDVDLMEVCAVVPAVMGALTTVLVFLLGSILESEISGLIAASILSLNYAFLSRTIAGFYDDESIAIPLLVLGLYFFLKSIKKQGIKNVIWAILAGIAFGYIVWTWGASTYVINMLALYMFLIFLLHKETRELVKSYLVTIAIITLFVILVPKRGFHYLMTLNYYLIWLTCILSVLYLIGGKRISKSLYKVTRVIFIIALVGALALLITGRYYGLSSRYLSVLNPFLRAKIPLVASVGEHRVPTWASLFLDFQIALVLALFDLYLEVKELTRERLLIIVYFLTSFYAACSMVRLAILAAPAIAVLAGIGTSRIFKSIHSVLVSKPKKTRKAHVRKEHIALTLFILFILLVIPNALPYLSSYSGTPSLIVSASLPVSTNYNYELLDWLSALAWIADNVPEDAVIASWWDYGYWISVIGNRTSVCDNGTLNSTQIRLVATAFLSNETVALKIFRRLNVKYVVVFEPYQVPRLLSYYYYAYAPNPQGYGDFGKSTWMARIAFGYGEEDNYIVEVRVSYGRSVEVLLLPANTERARNAVLYKMIFMHTDKISLFITDVGVVQMLKNYGFSFKCMAENGTLIDYTPPSFEELKYFKLVYESEPNGYVRIFEVIYPEENT